MKHQELTRAEAIMQLLYYVSQTLELFVEQTDIELAKTEEQLKYEKRRMFKEMCNGLKKFVYYAEKIDMEIGNVNTPVLTHDARLEGGNEFARLLLLYYDRCADDMQHSNDVFKQLYHMEGINLFPMEFVEKFRFRG